jgi:hypothetical protein
VRGLGARLPANRIQTNYLYPWGGGWWRLRDIIEYEKAATYGLLEFASKFREKVKTNYYNLNRKAIAEGSGAAPYGFIVPASQHDPSAAAALLDRFHTAGVRIEQLRKDILHEGRVFPAGSHYISLAQPTRSFIKDLLEKQTYPDLEQYPGGPPKRPYDITAWSLPLQMGVEVVEQITPGVFKTLIVEPGTKQAIPMPAATPYYAFERRFNNAFALAQALLKKGVPLFESMSKIASGGRELPLGTFVLPSGKIAQDELRDMSSLHQVPLHAVDAVSESALQAVGKARVGIYQPWITSMDEGWTRLVMDNFGVEYTILGNREIGKKDAALRKSYDVIILPDMGTNPIVDGRWGGGERRDPVLGTPGRPEEYKGGIGKEGIEAIRAFVNEGGTLLTLGGSSSFAIDKIRVPAVDELKGVSRNDFYAPGSILRVRLDPANPLTYGMKETAEVYFTNDPAFRLLPYNEESRIVATFAGEDVLASGWILGEKRISGKVALAEIPVGMGRVVMYGFRVQHRAQSHGTFKLFLNALLLRK